MECIMGGARGGCMGGARGGGGAWEEREVDGVVKPGTHMYTHTHTCLVRAVWVENFDGYTFLMSHFHFLNTNPHFFFLQTLFPLFL